MSVFLRGPFLAPAVCGVQQPMADVIASHGVQHQQFADDTQLRLAMATDNTAGSLSIFAACTADVRLWYMQNGLQLNPDKLEALIIGTTTQVHAVTSAVLLVAVAGAELPVADEIKVLGVVLDRRLTFEKHVMMVDRSCHYHTQAIRHMRHLLASTLERKKAKAMAYNTCIAPQDAYRSCSGAVHVTN